MAAAVLLRSMARKLARAPLQPPNHRHIVNRGVHGSTTATPTTDKDKIIENLRLRLWFARASAGIGGFMLTSFSIYAYFWLLPAVERERARFQLHAKKLKPGCELPTISLAQIIAMQEHRKQQRDGTIDEGTMADNKVQEIIPIAMQVCLDVLKETTASLEDVRAELKESRAALERISNVAPSKPKEGCSRVGSETLTPTS